MDSDGEISNNISLELIMSIVFGMVLGVLLYSIYQPPVIIHGPNSRNIVGKIFSYAGKKYRLDPKIYSCPDHLQLEH
jgi:hypothetical protein